MTTDTLTDHAIAAAFTDVYREWETEPGTPPHENRLRSSSARQFVRAVEARAAQYAERPADDSLDAAWAERLAAIQRRGESRYAPWDVPGFVTELYEDRDFLLRALAAALRGEKKPTADDSLDAACPNCGVRPSDYDRDAT